MGLVAKWVWLRVDADADADGNMDVNVWEWVWLGGGASPLCTSLRVSSGPAEENRRTTGILIR